MKVEDISVRRWKRFSLTVVTLAAILAAAPPRTAHAGVSVSIGVHAPFRPFFAPRVVYAPPAVYVPAPVYVSRPVYVTAPAVYARPCPRPVRVWVAGYWDCGRWVPAHWVERWHD